MTRNPTPDSSKDALWIHMALERYEAPLTLYATRLVGDIDRARDIVQDTFMRLWTADRSAVDGHLAQWLYRVCRNRALDVCRKEERVTSVQTEHLDLRSSPVDKASEEDERTTSVFALLEELSPRHQEVLRLKFQGGLSYQEIANVMDLTANHVGVLIHNALKVLRERMLEGKPRVEANKEVRSMT